jgi:hypothetical protein
MVDMGQRMNPRRWDGRIANYEKHRRGSVNYKINTATPLQYFQYLADN